MAPLDVMTSSMKKHSGGNDMQHFVCERKEPIATSRMHLQDEMSLDRTDVWCPVFEVLDPSDHEDFLREIVVTTCMVRSDYHRRVYRQCISFPAVMLWFAFRKPDVKCPTRARVATHLLEAPEATLDSASLKVRQLFKSDLEVMSENGPDAGECTGLFYLFMSDTLALSS